jgi:hypothetical protein
LITRNLRESEESIHQPDPPFEIEWSQFEKARMQADEELRKTNTLYTKVMNRDTGVLLGYEIAARMTGK